MTNKRVLFWYFNLQSLKQYCLERDCRGGSPFQPSVHKMCVNKFCPEFISTTKKATVYSFPIKISLYSIIIQYHNEVCSCMIICFGVQTHPTFLCPDLMQKKRNLCQRQTSESEIGFTMLTDCSQNLINQKCSNMFFFPAG